jgi:hypothetical protein
MLYDPKWEKKIESTADPLTVVELVAWLERRPADKPYCYTDVGHCLLAQYFSSLGYTEINLNPYWFWRGPNMEKVEYPPIFNEIALGETRTFGAALGRARAVLNS